MINEITYEEIDESTETSIKSVILFINKYIDENQIKFNLIGLRDGIAGISLFKFILGSFFEDEKFKNEGNQLLIKAVEKLNSGYVSGALYTELLEIAWLIEVMKNNQLLDLDVGNVTEDLEEIFLEFYYENLTKENYDPITGVLSFGYYFLEKSYNEKYCEKLNEIVDFLYKIIKTNEDQSMYFVSKLKEVDEIYLGITHGSSVVILFLIDCYEKLNLKNKELSLKMISGLLLYLYKRQYQNHFQLFPVTMSEHKYSSTYSKNYCYGDIGVIYAILRAEKFLSNDTGLMNATKLIKEFHEKGYDKPFLVAGYGLLYGSAGLAMLSREIFNMTNDKFSLEMHNYHIDKILKKFKPCDEFLGYSGYWNQSIAHTNLSFFEGIVGIGLELIKSLTSKKKLAYETFFFINN